MHFLIPKVVLKKYFISPYFKSLEISSFSGFPLSYVRTLMFMRVLGFPKSGKKRGLDKIYKDSPVLICILSKYIIISFLVSFSLFFLSIIFSGFHMLIR